MHIRDAVWCDYYDGYILDDDATDAITWIDADYCDKDDCDHSTNTVSEKEALVSVDRMECGEYLKDKVDYGVEIIDGILAFNSDTKTYYLSDFAIDTYKTEKGYLTEEDIEILGTKSKGTKRRTDIIAYGFNMDEATKKELLAALKSKILEIENMLSGKQTRLQFEEDAPGFMGDKKYLKVKEIMLDAYRKRLNKLNKWI